MTDAELKTLAEYVADIIYKKAQISVNKRLEAFIEKEYQKLHPEKLINREEFLSKKENKFYNYKTKKQIKGIVAVKAMLEQVDKYPLDDKSRYYATEGQFYEMKRRVLKDEKGISSNIKTAYGFVKTTIYNYYQTEEIPDNEYKPVIKRSTARSTLLTNKNKRLKFFAEHNFTCNCCKGIFPYEKLEIDHIKPISLGGRTLRSNLQCLCCQCNKKKSNKFVL